MRMHCRKQAMEQHHPMRPFIALTSLTIFAVSTIASLWMLERMTRALEMMAMTKAMDEMGDRMSDVERADLEGQIRSRLFPG